MRALVIGENAALDSRHELGQGHAIDEFHDEIRGFSAYLEVVDGNDVLIREARGNACLREGL